MSNRPKHSSVSVYAVEFDIAQHSLLLESVHDWSRFGNVENLTALEVIPPVADFMTKENWLPTPDEDSTDNSPPINSTCLVEIANPRLTPSFLFSWAPCQNGSKIFTFASSEIRPRVNDLKAISISGVGEKR